MGFSDLFYPWGFILQLLALLHFFRRRPEGYWFFVILFFGALGSLIYFLAEVVPDFGLLRATFRRRARQRRLKELEIIVEDNAAVGNLEELADLSFDEGQFARARELYDRVLKASRPTSVDPFYRRGLSALALGDPAAAVADLERVVAQEPKYDFYRATGMLASAYAMAGQPDRAEAQFQSATSISTLSETYFNYANFLADQKRTEEARNWAQRILDKKRSMPRFAQRQERPWFQKAKALLKKLG
ncbi:MAG TPA: tetratricopeptide repeat protein [Vicinamibacterales bacterium]|nr:tetratricopeptide repeat protein [Vicinamibacterales bacterium]